MAVNKVIYGKNTLIDLSSDTVAADKMLSGYTAHGANGEKITGNIATVTQATPSISVSSAGLITASNTQSTGYVSGGTKSATKQLTTQAEKTVTPSTVQQTAVASGRYTTGAVVVAGDANLVARNIKKGVSIFGIVGTYEGETSYTNQLFISTDTDGTIYNGVGYKANSYISSGNVGTKSGYYTSGFIPCKAGDTLYFKNCTLKKGDNSARFALYNSSKTYLSNRQYNTSNTSNMTFTFDSNDNVLTATVNTGSYHADAAYIRFCGTYLGEDSIVTVNEPIE